MHSRNFGFDFGSDLMGSWFWLEIVRTEYVRKYVHQEPLRPLIHVSRGEIFYFKYTRLSAVNLIATRTLEIKNNNDDLILKSKLAWITEKELEPEIKNKGDQFRQKNNMKIL